MTLEEEYDANNNNDKPVIANSEEKIFSENENVITNIERNKDKEKKIIRRRAQNGVDSDETIETDKDGNLISYEYIKSDFNIPNYLYHVKVFSDEKDTNHYIVSLYDPLRVHREIKTPITKKVANGNEEEIEITIKKEEGICVVSFNFPKEKMKTIDKKSVASVLRGINFARIVSDLGLGDKDNYYLPYEGTGPDVYF